MMYSIPTYEGGCEPFFCVNRQMNQVFRPRFQIVRKNKHEWTEKQTRMNENKHK